MRAMWRVGVLAAIIALTCMALVGCSGAGDQGNADKPATGQTKAAGTGASQGGAQAETEVAKMPAGFPSDVPVHPGTVTAYDPIKVTASTTVHQLTVESTASFDDVITWYKTQLPASWSVGFLKQDGDSGSREGKVALTGGSYTPANPDGQGGGVIIGVFEGDTTQVVTTVTQMAP